MKWAEASFVEEKDADSDDEEEKKQTFSRTIPEGQILLAIAIRIMHALNKQLQDESAPNDGKAASAFSGRLVVNTRGRTNLAGYSYFGNALAFPEIAVTVGSLDENDSEPPSVAQFPDEILFHTIRNLSKKLSLIHCNKKQLCEMEISYEALFEKENPLNSSVSKMFDLDIFNQKPMLECVQSSQPMMQFFGNYEFDFLDMNFGAGENLVKSFEIGKNYTKKNNVLIYKSTSENNVIRFSLDSSTAKALKRVVEELKLPVG